MVTGRPGPYAPDVGCYAVAELQPVDPPAETWVSHGLVLR
jgi:hypothetical protein